jgi:hypothetical protein
MRPKLVRRQIHVGSDMRRRRGEIQQTKGGLEMIQGVTKHLLTTGLVVRQSCPHYLHFIARLAAVR